MSLIPDSKTGKVAFFQTRVAPWTTSATLIGTTTQAVTDLGTKVTAAETAIAGQDAAYATYRAAVMTANNAVRTMVTAGSDIIKAIRAKAAVSGEGVYELAQIPAPATPTPVAPPGKPANFAVMISDSGALKLKWKCANPRGSGGTIYQIARRVGTGAMMPIGVSGTKSFIDVTVPAGVASITYQIQAVRSTALGEAAQFTVNFGVSDGGALITSVAPRLAA